MKIIITGANGQLGQDVKKILSLQHEVYAFGRAELDITDQQTAKKIIFDIQPDAIIHCAAYTAVDLAESNSDDAYTINASGVRNIAVAAEAIGAKICYVSTDYVFEGNSASPYNEYDQTNPQSIYGKSKRAGEVLVQTLSRRYFIVRTSWLYGAHGNNFVKTMLKLASEKRSLKVVDDQIGSPTYTVDLSNFLSELITTEKYGIYHASNMGSCSWFQFAQAIFEEEGICIQLDPCTTEEFPRPAPRPRYSVMDHMAIRINGFEELPHWKEGLRAFLRELKGLTHQ